MVDPASTLERSNRCNLFCSKIVWFFAIQYFQLLRNRDVARI